MTAIDSPEDIFRALPHAARRWSLRLLLRRLRIPFKIRRRRKRLQKFATAFPKAPTPATDGPVLAVGGFGGSDGLSRAATYELERLREEHPDLEVLDFVKGETLAEDGPPIGRLYLLVPPTALPYAFAALPESRVRDAYRVALWVWETPIFPSYWLPAFDVVHEIWTPSEYSRQAIAPVAGDLPVIVRPHNVAPSAEITPFDPARYGLPADAFIGLAVMDLAHGAARKNPWARVAAWRAAFGDNPARHLMMKVQFSDRLTCVRRELEWMTRDVSNVNFVDRQLPSAEIAGMQSGADVYLSLHRAEGYGLNIHECLGYGTPVVATDFSANAEYGPAFPNYHPVPYRMVPYRDWTLTYFENRFDWAEADIAGAAESLRGIAAAWAARRSAGGGMSAKREPKVTKS